MAHLWVEQPSGEWAVIPLQSPRIELRARTDGALRARRVRDGARVAIALRDNRSKACPAWYLLGRPEARLWLNGLPLLGGFHVMADRDEIRIPGAAACFFSTEELAQVVAMPDTGAPLPCPRCRQRLEPGVSAVKCPGCGLWHHQSEELPCWTYAPACALCPQPTALDAGFQWTPVEL